MGDYCVRVSPRPQSWAKSRERCQSEGADLLYILNSNMQVQVNDFIDRKREEHEIYKEKKMFWTAGVVDPDVQGWAWASHYQSFDKFSYWLSQQTGKRFKLTFVHLALALKSLAPPLLHPGATGCGDPGGCQTNVAMLLQQETGYQWFLGSSTDTTEVSASPALKMRTLQSSDISSAFFSVGGLRLHLQLQTWLQVVQKRLDRRGPMSQDSGSRRRGRECQVSVL